MEKEFYTFEEILLALREEYIKEFRAAFRQQLDNTYVMDENGNKVPVKEYNK